MNEFEISREVRSTRYSMTQSHYHDYYELYYLLSGSCRMFVGHSLYHGETGDILLLSPGMLHRATYPEGSEALRITILFDSNLLIPLTNVCGPDYLSFVLEQVQVRIPIPIRPQVELLLDKIQEEMAMGDPLSVFLAKNHFYELMAAIGRYGLSRRRKTVGETENAIQEAARYISQNFEKSLSLKEMSEMVHMTPTYFSRRFKQVTGFGFKEYVIYTRIAQAERMLNNTSLSVTEIAAACGFEDGNYFGDCFKKQTGISPMEYRRRTGSITIT